MQYRRLLSRPGRSLAGTVGLLSLSAWMPGAIVHAAVPVSMFTPPPGSGQLSESTGGASRSSFFAPKPGQGTVTESTGGSSRNNFFAPKPGQGTVTEATGGGSRGDSLFVPPADRRSLRESTGGASRGLFRPKRGQGTVQESTAGGSRNGGHMLALLPQTFSGITISARPTLWVYLPESSAKTAVFSLQDEQGDQYYQMSLSIEGKSGVIPITLPPDAPELQEGKNYQWFVGLMLGSELTPKAPYVDGWIQRVAISNDIRSALQTSNALQRAEVLGRNGIWYDCVDALAQLRQTQPNDSNTQQAWQSLMQAVELPMLATVPIDNL